MQCGSCYKWVHLRCSLLSCSRCKTLSNSYSWSCPPCCIPASYEGPTSTNTTTPLQGPPAFIPPLFNLVDLLPFANAALLPDPRLHQTFSAPSSHFVSSSSAPSPPPQIPGCFPIPPASSIPPFLPLGS